MDDLVGTWATTTTWGPEGDPLTEGVESDRTMAFSYVNGSVERLGWELENYGSYIAVK